MLKESSFGKCGPETECVHAEKCVNLVVLHIILNSIQTSEGKSCVSFLHPSTVIIFPL